METEKSHNFLSVNWRMEKASGVIQVKSKGLKTRGANGLNLSYRARDEIFPTGKNQKSKIKNQKKRVVWGVGGNSSFFCLLFYLGLQGIG